ncbi:hypothetical protein Cni_G23645 [Canna indica]|uniref:Reverse transcriptase n=1 Tax=Canna indica TaxID=4628 RepID=A0AAQ3QKN0_9LILI|nr:hypothetical protein Cni_G23645 [Canna indica]
MRIKVSNTMNMNLTRPVIEGEIKGAVFSLDPNAAPMDNGFTSWFFQYYWEILGRDVCKAVQNFFSDGRMLKSFNYTHTCLVPKWIKVCISIVSYSAIVDGQPVGFFRPSRGLRQGDLSPYLFLFYPEGLTHLLYTGEQLHKANEAHCKNLLDILHSYGEYSARELTTLNDKYLGLPSVVGRSKRIAYTFVKEKEPPSRSLSTAEMMQLSFGDARSFKMFFCSNKASEMFEAEPRRLSPNPVCHLREHGQEMHREGYSYTTY